MDSAPNVLVVGANGRMGVALIRMAETLPSHPKIHAFLRTPTKLPDDCVNKCASIISGDGTNTDDIIAALESSKAEYVVLVAGKSIEQTDVRERCAQALMHAISKDGPYAHVKVVAISTWGAGGTKIQVGLGVGAAVSWMIRHALKDHNNQEDVMWGALGDDVAQKKRLMVIHSNRLKDGEATEKKAKTFETGKAPSKYIHREDLATWVLEEICGQSEWFGKATCITGGK